MKNNFMKSENFTKWAIRKVSVGVVSAAIASGIFVIVGGGEAHASDKQLDKEPIVETVKTQVDENVVTKPTEKTESVETTTVKPKETDKIVEQPVVGTDKGAKPEVTENNILSLAKDTVDAPKVDAPDMTTHKTTPAEVKKAVMDNTKDEVNVPAKYLDKANFPGPFTAGVNQVIPYHLFAGDGMLTRLILKSSDKAPWSDNGTAKNPALPPVENLTQGLYFYEVDLAGTQGKQDKELLDLLKANGTQSYKATIKVYGEKDGKADLTNLVATKDVNVNLNGLTTVNEVKKAVMDNTKDTIDVPAKYLDKANFPGPFTAGVNQVIPYHLFAGDGMLTRLILKVSDKAPWSDNGTAKNPALPPVEKLGHGLYFYEVDLAGTQGKQDKELLDLLKANRTQSYKATIKVYGEKDGKADLTNLVALKEVTVNLHKEAMEMEKKPGENMMTDHKNHGSMDPNMSEKPMDMHKSNVMNMKAHMSDVMNMKSHMHKDMKEKNMNAHMNNDMMKKGMLPKTSAAPEGTMNATNSTNSSTTGLVALIIASLLGYLGIRRKNEID